MERIPGAPESEMRFVGFGADEVQISYRELYREARRRAAHLAGMGLKKGDRAALMMSEAHEFVQSFLGTVIAGVIPVPIPPPLTTKGGENFIAIGARIVENSGARALLTTETSRNFADRMLHRADCDAQLATTETAFAGDPPTFDPPRIDPDDVCFLQYTSGSTNVPKGVMVTHANLMANISAFLGPDGMYAGPEDVGLSWLPLYHDMGLIGFILGPLIYIGPVVIMPATSFARDPRSWLKAIDKYRATIICAPNFAYAHVVKRLRDQDLENLDLSCVRVAGCGAEPIHAPTLQTFAERLAPAGFRAETFMPSYGLAESTLAVTLHSRGKPIRTERIDLDNLKRGKAQPVNGNDGRAVEVVSCGSPFPGHQLLICNEQGNALHERGVGEIVVRGPSVARGYFQNPDATAQAWKDGWFHTGDLGYLADGELFVCGRSKELIIVRGANYYPQDIEWLVRDLPGIKRGNVVAFSVDAGGEERLVIVAEADSGDAESTRKAIATKIQESTGLDVYKVMMVSVGTLTRTTSGKLQRNRIKQLFEQGQLQELT
jgi:fatty-acyl-CoA synthase